MVFSILKNRKIGSAIKKNEEALERASKYEAIEIKSMYLYDQIKFLDKEIKENESEPIYLLLRAEALNQTEKYSKAKEDLEKIAINDANILQKITRYFPEAKKKYFKQLSIAELNDNEDKAARHFLMATVGEDLPEEILAEEVDTLVLGSLYEITQNEKKAYEKYNKLIQLSPNLDTDSLKMFKEMSKTENEAVKSLESPAGFFLKLARLEEGFGKKEIFERLEKSIEYYRKAKTLNPKLDLEPEIMAINRKIERFRGYK